MTLPIPRQTSLRQSPKSQTGFPVPGSPDNPRTLHLYGQRLTEQVPDELREVSFAVSLDELGLVLMSSESVHLGPLPYDHARVRGPGPGALHGRTRSRPILVGSVPTAAQLPGDCPNGEASKFGLLHASTVPSIAVRAS